MKQKIKFRNIGWKNHGIEEYLEKAEQDYLLKQAGKKGLDVKVLVVE